ncbi:hypothetical protein XHV734_0393 [Xanthomonas hortorum pv. vitians]|nr:hypothetical protein XHV734_0393 [Xanthomonas hortorum pv. vitians]
MPEGRMRVRQLRKMLRQLSR